jgi:hypothetical protein
MDKVHRVMLMVIVMMVIGEEVHKMDMEGTNGILRIVILVNGRVG